ncbi:MAG: DNA primase [Firmicutes bacterium]|nr:DNA primase [Bacillota bacterium]
MARADGINIAEEIKSRCNIVDVVGRVVPLKKAGSNYKGVCPFHNEKTPSFVVSETKQIFTCFGCGATGDVIGFVEKYYNVDFKGAVEMLAREYGIDISQSFGSRADKEEYYEINRMAARFFYKALREKSNPGYTYMAGRGLTNETLNKFGIGYADEQWHSLTDYLTSQGFAVEKLAELGLVSSSKGRYYDKFRGRVIFPILNTSGKVIGFGGRIIGDGEPKYLNSPESPVFRKKNNLYGLNLAKDTVNRDDSIVLVEGYMDVISLSQSGIRNVAASLGTALTENQARLIRRYTKNVILSYDADSAGQNAADRGLDILYAEGLNSKVLKVTDGKDPDEFIKKNGKAAFKELMDNAVPYGDFKLSHIKKKYDLSKDDSRIAYASEVVGELRKMKPVEADIYFGKLAEITGISEGAIRSEYNSENDMMSRRYVPESERNREGKPDPVERNLIRLMMYDSEYTDLPDDVREYAFRSSQGKAIYEAVRETVNNGEEIEPAEIYEILENETGELLKEILEGVPPGDKGKKIFDECIDFIRVRMLKEEDAMITVKLSMADEETDNEELKRLMSRQMEIQKMIQGRGGKV